jgi:hypothetical protein
VGRGPRPVFLSIDTPLQSLTDLATITVADNLPKWKASLVNPAGRLTTVKTVLTAIPFYLMIAFDLPKWVVKTTDKKGRGFLWAGRDKANGGYCLA